MELNPETARASTPGLLRPSLSPTERRVGSLLAAGYADAEIAARLLVSAQTVAWSVAKLCRTLDVGSRAELAVRLAGRPASCIGRSVDPDGSEDEPTG